MQYDEDISTISNFRRDTKAHVSRIKATGQPLALSVNGKVEMVMQDARAYQELMEKVERLSATHNSGSSGGR
jgi:PHD/YefM family antitoxin component YafN of YafNO toxin-antitoxin module